MPKLLQTCPISAIWIPSIELEEESNWGSHQSQTKGCDSWFWWGWPTLLWPLAFPLPFLLSLSLSLSLLHQKLVSWVGKLHPRSTDLSCDVCPLHPSLGPNRRIGERWCSSAQIWSDMVSSKERALQCSHQTKKKHLLVYRVSKQNVAPEVG